VKPDKLAAGWTDLTDGSGCAFDGDERTWNRDHGLHHAPLADDRGNKRAARRDPEMKWKAIQFGPESDELTPLQATEVPTTEH